MSLLSNYKTLAILDLDNSISHLQNYDSDTSAYFQMATETENNINFAERISLLTRHEAQAYRDRLQKARNEFDRRQREERIAQQRKPVPNREFIEHKKEQYVVNRPPQERVTNTPQNRSRSSDFERSR